MHDTPQPAHAGVETRVVGIRTGAVGKHSDLRVGKGVAREPGVPRGCDRSGTLADNDDLLGVGEVLSEIAERGRAVDIAIVLDGEVWRVLPRRVANMYVPGAIRHIHHGVVGERVAVVREVEDASLKAHDTASKQAPRLRGRT